MLKLFFTLIVVSLPFSIAFTIDLNSPLLLTSNLLKITTIDLDLDNNFLVGFQNGQARRYSSDFSSFTDLAVPEAVDQFGSWEIQLNNIILSNGTTFSMSSRMTSILSNGFTTLRIYSEPSFVLLETFSFNQPIFDYRGLPFDLPQYMNPFHILVFNLSIQVIYKNTTTVAFNLTQIYGSLSYLTAVCLSSSSTTIGSDYIIITYTYIQAVAGIGILQNTITLAFAFNYTTQSYDLVVSYSCYNRDSSIHIITSLQMANGVLLIQYSDGQLRLRYGSTLGMKYPDVNIQMNIGTNPVLEFSYIAGNYYILYSSALVKPNISASGTSFQSPASILQTFPNNTYSYILGSVVSVFYAQLASQIYKMGCSGQYNWDYSSCTSYTCSVANCSQCGLTATTCESCAFGYALNDSLICSLNVNVSNTTNVTNMTLNNTLQGQQNGQFYSVLPLLLEFPLLEDIFFGFVNTTQKLISIPSARQLAVWFYFFGNFDDLYLYMFHDRLYGPTFTSLFEQVNTIETEKWNALNFAGELNWLSANSSLTLIANYQQDYLTYAYNTPGRPSGSSEGLLANCKSYFVVGIPMLIIGFILLRWLFGVLWCFPVSRLLRRFDFWGFLFFLIFQGNIQQFAFYVTAELRNTFSFKVGDRVLKAIIAYFGFLLVVISVGGFFIAFGTYRKLNRHLTDNNRNTLRGISFLVLQEGVRNLLLGALHSILRTMPYSSMMSILMLVEGVFFCLFGVSAGRNIYLSVSPIWIYLILTFIRILLISTLLIDYTSVGDSLMQIVQCTLLVLMISVYLIATLMALTRSVVQLVAEARKICQSSSVKKQLSTQRIKLSKGIAIIFHPTVFTAQNQPTEASRKNKLQKQLLVQDKKLAEHMLRCRTLQKNFRRLGIHKAKFILQTE